METRKITEKPVAPCCNNCVYLNFAAPQMDSPYGEIWCGMNMWDICDDQNLYAPNNCDKFLKRKIYVRY
jgi:hypothetical protein